MEPDFSGYATKAGLKCTDGRIIKPEAFQHMDGMTVPLVWHHGHKEATNVLGHAKLEARVDGMYAYGFFNNTPTGQHAKAMVQHGDIDSLSIWANQLREMNKIVHGGTIREVSLVMSGANPGAKIDNVRIVHGSDPEDFIELDDEVLISRMGGPLEVKHEASDKSVDGEKTDEIKHDEDDETGEDIYNSLTPKQKDIVHLMIGAALEEAAGSKDDVKHAEDDDSKEATEKSDKNDEGIAHQEGNDEMSRNLFENTENNKTAEDAKHTLSHDDMKQIFSQGQKLGSLKMAVEQYASTHLEHGITDIDILFPDARNVTGAPELDKRRTEWVRSVINGTRHTPFSRIKTLSADLTQDAARAKGYIKGEYKNEEWFGVTKRTTTPTTVYKKQKLDRDDVLDITDFDIVAFLKAEMRLMTEEEIARAVLIGDGRAVEHEDKVKDPQGASSGAGIRSILNDHELYVTTLNVNVDDSNSSYEEVVDAVMDGMEFYKGTGTPTFYTTIPELNKFLKARDGEGRRYYKNKQEVADALGVKEIITVEPMKEVTDLIGIIVNLDDYNVGTDKGGELTMFDDFDIDYNAMKYLIETRLSGALTKVKSALVIKKTAANSVLAKPAKPTFNASTGVVTIPTVTGVVYKDSEGDTIAAGAMSAIAAGTEVDIYSVAASGYHFADTATDSWKFRRNPA
jgi:HK97 family phage prohead protease